MVVLDTSTLENVSMLASSFENLHQSYFFWLLQSILMEPFKGTIMPHYKILECPTEMMTRRSASSYSFAV